MGPSERDPSIDVVVTFPAQTKLECINRVDPEVPKCVSYAYLTYDRVVSCFLYLVNYVIYSRKT